MGSSISGHHLAGRQGPLFVLRHGPVHAAHCVLVLPPFADEMNKTRRMLTLLAVQLAEHGIATVVPDLYGTGDSGGDFHQADWNLWRDDVQRTARWCDATGIPVTGLLAVRLGCSLACEEEVLASMPALTRTVFWQPVLDGSRYLTQFLRLRVAASMANDIKESVADLRRELQTVGEIEVSGYGISATLAATIDRLKEPAALPQALGTIDWLEIVRESGQAISPWSGRLLQSSIDAGSSVETTTIVGEPFWAATEIVVNDELVNRSANAFVRDIVSPARSPS